MRIPALRGLSLQIVIRETVMLHHAAQTSNHIEKV